MALLSDYISEIDKKKLEEYMRSLPTDSSSDISKIEQPQDLSVNLASSVIPKSMMPEQFKDIKIEEPNASSPIERLPTAKSKEVVQPNKISESPSQPLQEVVTPQPKFDVRDQELEQAQAESAERASWNRILGGIERAHDISTLSDLKYYSPEQAKQRDMYAQEPVERVKTKRTALLDRIKTEQEKTELDVSQQMADPNSEISKIYLEGAAKLGFDIPKGTSAAALGKVFRPLIDALNTQESIRARIQQAKDNLEERKLRREELTQQRVAEEARKGEQYQQTFRAKIQKQIKDSKEFKDAQEKLNSLDSLEYFINESEKIGGPALSALGAYLAKSIEGGGRLTNEDVRRYIQEPAFLKAGMQRAKAFFQGKLPQSTAQNLRSTLKNQRDIAKKHQSIVMDREAKSLMKSDPKNFGDFDKARAFTSVDDDYVPGQSQSSEQSDEKVRIKLPDGSVAQIPKSKLNEAKKRGATEL